MPCNAETHLQDCLANADLIREAFVAADASESACTRAFCSSLLLKRQRMMHHFQVNMLGRLELSSTRRCAHMRTDEDGVIGAHEAPAFFLPSGLPGDVLSRIWRLSAPDNSLRTPVSAASALTEAGSAILSNR